MKLYKVICQYQSSQCIRISAWEQVRFHHEALISLACLHGQLSTMLLGPILVGNVVFVCFNLYYVLTVHAGVLGVINVIVATTILSIIIGSSSILENEVGEMSFEYTKLCKKWPRFWRRCVEMLWFLQKYVVCLFKFYQVRFEESSREYNTHISLGKGRALDCKIVK